MPTNYKAQIPVFLKAPPRPIFSVFCKSVDLITPNVRDTFLQRKDLRVRIAPGLPFPVCTPIYVAFCTADEAIRQT